MKTGLESNRYRVYNLRLKNRSNFSITDWNRGIVSSSRKKPRTWNRPTGRICALRLAGKYRKEHSLRPALSCSLCDSPVRSTLTSRTLPAADGLHESHDCAVEHLLVHLDRRELQEWKGNLHTFQKLALIRDMTQDPNRASAATEMDSSCYILQRRHV